MIYRNKKLLELARETPYCMNCRRPNQGDVVAAHANMQSMGKGMGIKSADLPAYLCQSCHDEIDGRTKSNLSREEQQCAWALAAVHSLRWALEEHPEVFK